MKNQHENGTENAKPTTISIKVKQKVYNNMNYSFYIEVWMDVCMVRMCVVIGVLIHEKAAKRTDNQIHSHMTTLV